MSSIIAPRSHVDIHAQQQHHQQRSRQPSLPTHRPASPSAPPYSPITPKVQPSLPVTNSSSSPALVPPENGGNFNFSFPIMSGHPPTADSASTMTSPPAQQIVPPPTLPFSGEDSTDAIALRAAISTLQFQKKKAQDDLKTLVDIKKLALDDPQQFKAELVAGRLKEERPTIGGLRAILDGSDESDSDEEDDEEEPATLGADREDSNGTSSQPPELGTEIPDSQPSLHPQAQSKSSSPTAMDVDKAKGFPRIPGPQAVVRTPHVNWAKYGVVGGPLDSLHAQQQRWPGSAPFTRDRGREYSVAAPFNPFLDDIETQTMQDGQEIRKDSGTTPVSATGTISEHPMETRSRN